MAVDERGRSGGRVGVREVAHRAGVSTQTVSRVLNDHPGIRPDTRVRVLEAMAALDYRVNNAARSLGTRRTRTIGVIASDATLYGPAVGIAALEAAAREAGHWVTTAYAEAGDDASVRAAVDHVRAQGVDGIILVAPHAQTLEALASADVGFPLVALHGGAGAVRQREGAVLVVDHLVALGHRRIARLGGPEEWLDEQARAIGHREALESHELVPGSLWVGDWSAAAGAAAASAVVETLQGADPPTAVVVANDQMALGLIAGLDAAGLSVPRDVSIVGFDDNPDAAYYRPTLTTVRLDIEGEARRCVDAVLGGEAAAHATAPVAQASAPRLIQRDSAAPPR